MRCPHCEAAGETSIVTCGGTISTLMAPWEFWDEEGVWHHHDMNSQTTEYRCSHGHDFAYAESVACPGCDFGRQPARLLVDG